MKQTWRWYGKADKVTLSDARQAGAEGIVTSLHHRLPGELWTRAEIAERQSEIRRMPDGSATGMEWEVVESLPVSEAIKTQSGEWQKDIEIWRQSLKNLAAQGIRVICYNFMPVLDWTRTDLAWKVPHGGSTMLFDIHDFAAFDIFLLKRNGADSSYSKEIINVAEQRFLQMNEAKQNELKKNIVAGLPGAAETLSFDDFKTRLNTYASIDADKLRSHLISFLQEVVPLAEKLDMRLCCHPDDPPFSLLGLPRIMSTENDYSTVLNAVESQANGMTLCSGSLGARKDNDLPGMVERLGPKIHFTHLRNVKRDDSLSPCSFYEDGHLDGDTDMVALIQALLNEEKRREKAGRSDAIIPMRPDHGQEIFNDSKVGSNPGYPGVGRLKGLAELRGVMRALEYGN